MSIEEIRNKIMLVEEISGEINSFMEKARQVLNDDLHEFYDHKYPEDNYQAGAIMKYGITKSETRLNIVMDYLIATQQKLDQLTGTMNHADERHDQRSFDND